MVNNERFVHVPLNLQQSIRIYFLLSHIFLHLLQINQSSDENDLWYKTIMQNINEKDFNIVVWSIFGIEIVKTKEFMKYPKLLWLYSFRLSNVKVFIFLRNVKSMTKYFDTFMKCVKNFFVVQQFDTFKILFISSLTTDKGLKTFLSD